MEAGRTRLRTNAESFARRIAGKVLRARERKTDESFINGKVLRGEAVEDTRKPLPKKAQRTKLEDAAEMILLVAGRFPHLRIRVDAVVHE